MLYCFGWINTTSSRMLMLAAIMGGVVANSAYVISLAASGSIIVPIAALGMATNGTFSFFGPLCCWILLGLIFHIQGWTIPPLYWICAILATNASIVSITEISEKSMLKSRIVGTHF